MPYERESSSSHVRVKALAFDLSSFPQGIAAETASWGENLRVHDTATEDFDRTMAINARGVWLGCKYALAQFLEQEALPANSRGERARGWIVNMASMLGTVGFPNTPCYTPSKHAVVGMTRQIAVDYAKDRIHCNALCPGFVETPMIGALQQNQEQRAMLSAAHPWGALGVAEDVAKAAVFLVSDDA